MFITQYVLISINCISNSPVLNFGFNIPINEMKRTKNEKINREKAS